MILNKEQHREAINKKIVEWKGHLSNDAIIDLLASELAKQREMNDYKERECKQLTRHLRNLTDLPY